jgi:hypothetical protein
MSSKPACGFAMATLSYTVPEKSSVSCGTTP